jgi:hypothetical protein
MEKHTPPAMTVDIVNTVLPVIEDINVAIER